MKDSTRALRRLNAKYAALEAELRVELAQGDPFGQVMAEFAAKHRQEIDRELQARADRAARNCQGESLALFPEEIEP